MKTTTSIKLDKEVKQEAAKLAAELGLSLSSIINATLKQFVNERRIVFSIEPELNAKKKAEFLKMREDIKNNKNLSKPYTDLDELFADLEV